MERKKVVILAYDEKDIDYLIKKQKKLSKRDIDAKIISLNVQTDYFLQRRNAEFSSIHETDDRIFDTDTLLTKTHDFLLSLGKLRIPGQDHTLDDIFEARGVKILRPYKSQLMIITYDLFAYITLIDWIIRTESPDEIIYNRHYFPYFSEKDINIVPDVIEAICKQKNIFSKKIRPSNAISDLYRKLRVSLIKKTFPIIYRYRQFQRKDMKSLDRPNPGTSYLMFFHFGYVGTEITLPIARSLENSSIDGKKFRCIYFCGDGLLSNQTINFALKENLDYITPENFIDQNVRKEARQKEHEMKKSWEYLTASHRFTGLFEHERVNFFGIFYRILSEGFALNLNHHLTLISAIDKALERFKPDMCFNVNDQLKTGHASCELAKMHDCRSVLFAHGLGIFDYHPLNADYCLVWSNNEMDLLKKYGEDKSKLFVTGTAGYEILQKRYRSFDPDEIRKRLSIKDGKRVIYFIAFYQIKSQLGDLDKIYEIAKKRKDSVLLVKLHPQDNSISIKKLHRMYPAKNTIFIQDTNFYQYLKIADFTIARYNSSTCFDSVMFRKPCVVFNSPGYLFCDAGGHYEFNKKGAPFIEISDIGNLNSDLVNRLLTDKLYVSDIKKKQADWFEQNYHKVNFIEESVRIIKCLLKEKKEIQTELPKTDS